MFGNEFIKLVFSTFLIFGLYILYRAIRNSVEQQYPIKEFERVVPFSSGALPKCAYKRVSCDPSVQYDCANKCSDANKDSLKCVDMNALGGGENGGGYVCLPDAPKPVCNTTNGGVMLWTGYGMTNQQGWSCFCSQPLAFNGPSCDDKNPSYCSGGTIEFPSLNCTCPSSSVKMRRIGSNTPFCASKRKEDGGGAYGLIGNYKIPPNWGNVYYNLDLTDDYRDWSVRILEQLNLDVTDENAKAIMTVIKNSETELANLPPFVLVKETPSPSPSPAPSTSPSPQPTPTPLSKRKIIQKLDDYKVLVKKICDLPFVKESSKSWARSMCSDNSSGNELSTVPTNEGKPAYTDVLSEVSYTYYDKTYPSLM